MMRECVRRYLRTTGEILVTSGLVVLGFVAYLYWGTAAREGGAQHGFVTQLGRQWNAAGPSFAVLANPDDIAVGRPFALLRIPRFGPGWRLAVVQGSGPAQLALGPGHVLGTAMPGQVGNFAVAGHRVTAGNPFWSLPSLRPGDMVYVETIAGTYEYRVASRPNLVAPDDTAALAAVPWHPGEAPSRAMITLITCSPPWTSTSRLIVTGVLIATLPRGPEVAG
jgi:sortase A